MQARLFMIVCVFLLVVSYNTPVYSQIDSIRFIEVKPIQSEHDTTAISGSLLHVREAELMTALMYAGFKDDTLYFSDTGVSYKGKLHDSCLYYFKGLQSIKTDSYIRKTFSDTICDCGTDFLILKTAMIGFQSCENPSNPAIRFIVEFGSTEYHSVIRAYDKYCAYFRTKKSMSDKEIWNFLRNYLLKYTNITLLRVFTTSFINQYYNE